MKKLVLLLAVIFGFSTLGFNSIHAEATEETPIEEVITETTETTETTEEDSKVVELTPEELESMINEAIDNALSIAVGFWEVFTAAVGTMGIGAFIYLFIFVSKRLKIFGDKEAQIEGALGQVAFTLSTLAKTQKEVVDEESKIKAAVIGLISIANIDPYTKGELLKSLESGKLESEQVAGIVAKLAQDYQENANSKTAQTKSLLDELDEL